MRRRELRRACKREVTAVTAWAERRGPSLDESSNGATAEQADLTVTTIRTNEELVEINTVL